MKRILSALTLLLLAAGLVSAQGGYLVKGVVEDAMGPVIGATVFLTLSMRHPFLFSQSLVSIR